MQTFLVGGAVRDRLLGRPVRERDWVVVGGTEAAMQAAGFRRVGRDFPVFLHPETGEEHALARTERKTGAGHTGFECYAAEDVTLEQDLERRDLTINAMAEDADGHLIDPFGGQRDLERRVLRHVSAAFLEDPLRLFRVARFAALLPEFSIDAETLALMRGIARRGELSELSAERVWGEWHKALAAPAPARFLETLVNADALAPWFEGLDPQASVATLGAVTFPGAVECHCALGWVNDADALTDIMARLKAPKRFAVPPVVLARHRPVLADWRGADASSVLDAMTDLGAFRDKVNLGVVLRVLEMLADGRDAAALGELADELDRLRPKTSATGAAYGRALRAARLERIAQAASKPT